MRSMCEVLPFLASSMEWRCLNPGRDELTSARLLGRLVHAMAGGSFQPSSRTLETPLRAQARGRQVRDNSAPLMVERTCGSSTELHVRSSGGYNSPTSKQRQEQTPMPDAKHPVRSEAVIVVGWSLPPSGMATAAHPTTCL